MGSVEIIFNVEDYSLSILEIYSRNLALLEIHVRIEIIINSGFSRQFTEIIILAMTIICGLKSNCELIK